MAVTDIVLCWLLLVSSRWFLWVVRFVIIIAVTVVAVVAAAAVLRSTGSKTVFGLVIG